MEKDKKQVKKPVLAVDFDGTINSYKSGWVSPDVIPDPPTEKSKESLEILSKFFTIVIFSVRAKSELGKKGIAEYMKKYDLPYNSITDKKPNGLIIDDNCLQFKGWDNTVRAITEFEHWQKNKLQSPKK